MKLIDLRSDTVTQPTKEMLEAILQAELGDDSRSHEDPTVNKLEKIAAEITGKQAALLVPSGIMGNTVSVLANTSRGDKVIVERTSHLYASEIGSWMILGDLYPVTIQGKNGYMDPYNIETELKISTKNKPSLICTENTHNNAGGTVMTMSQMEKTWDLAQTYGVKIHCDGARIFNAAIYLDTEVKNLCQFTDSIMFCISKGLSAPVGSLVCGSKEFIEQARFYRKLLGGAMRQAGIIAAPGIISLTQMVTRLKEDHENAALLAKGLDQIPGIRLLNQVQTNIIFVDLTELGITGDDFRTRMFNYGIRTGGGKISEARLVTHRGITKENVQKVIESTRCVVSDLKGE